MRRRWVWVLVAFGASRALAGWVTDNPDDVYAAGTENPSDVGIYEGWARAMQDEDRRAYDDFDVEYPPGALVLANAPYAVDDDHYREGFILANVVLDGLALLAIWRVAARRDAWWGVGAWLVLVPLLGPVAYTRLDLLLAVTLAWALERIDAGQWDAAAVILGVGIAAKLTPVLVLPAVAMVAPQRVRTVVLSLGVASLFVLPFLFDVGAVYDQAVGFHADRGVHGESLWGSSLLLARALWDAPVDVVFAFGAYEVRSSITDELKLLSNLAAVGVVLDSALMAARRVRRGDGAHVVLVVTAALLLATAVGRVFSPQYVVELLAVVAIALAVAPKAMRAAAALLGAVAVLSHLLYPLLFHDFLDADPVAVGLAVARNVAVLACGVLAARAARSYAPPLLAGTTP